MQIICCTVLPTSYAFLPPNIDFPNLSQRTHFFGGTFSESSELYLGMVGIKYGGDLFSRFCSIWETEISGSIQSSQRKHE